MIDRRTGRPVGPPVPIHPDDWPYGEIGASEVLWRYMDFWKFVDLLQSSALYFSRADQFKDPFEGRFTPANSTTMSNSDAAFYRAYRLERLNEQLLESQEIMRHVVFISCWQRSKSESREMWEAYTSRPESVVVATSAKALERFLPDSIVKSPVKYHHMDFPRTEFGHTALFFYKPSGYAFENEFRLLLTPDEGESVRHDELGRHVGIRLTRIIHRVIAHPRATDEFKTRIGELLKHHVGGVRCEKSRIVLV